MPRIAMLLAAFCIVAAPIVAATDASAQRDAEKTDKGAKPKTDKDDGFDIDKALSGIKGMIEKELKDATKDDKKEDKNKNPGNAPAEK